LAKWHGIQLTEQVVVTKSESEEAIQIEIKREDLELIEPEIPETKKDPDDSLDSGDELSNKAEPRSASGSSSDEENTPPKIQETGIQNVENGVHESDSSDAEDIDVRENFEATPKHKGEEGDNPEQLFESEVQEEELVGQE